MVYSHDGQRVYEGLIYHVSVKFGVARFDNMGNFQDALGSEASDEWASRFFCLYVFKLFI